MTSQPRATLYTYFETEVWKAIPNHEGYEASSFGNIRNSKTNIILKPVKWGSRGHLAVKVGGGRKASKKYIHRLVLMAFNGMPEDGKIACHKNDVKTDNRLENLYWGTYKENTSDQIRNGKFYYAIGEKNGMTKYNNQKIALIRQEYTGKRGDQTRLAKKYCMSVSNVNLIVRNLSRTL